MDTKNGISAVLNTWNAEEHLDEVLKSLKGFDEIVVCDMESTDSTLDIARKYGCKILTYPRKGTTICEPARNTAIRAASCPWVLVVDADEICTPELRDYLYKRVATTDCPEGLYVPRVNRFMGEFSYVSAERLLRFVKRDCCDWPPTIHSVAKIEGRVDRIPMNLKGVHMLHLADSSLHAAVDKMNRYTDEELARRMSKKWGLGALIYRPMFAFFKSYVLKRGFMDGKRGLIRAYMQAQYQRVLVSKLIERKLDQRSN